MQRYVVMQYVCCFEERPSHVQSLSRVPGGPGSSIKMIKDKIKNKQMKCDIIRLPQKIVRTWLLLGVDTAVGANDVDEWEVALLKYWAMQKVNCSFTQIVSTTAKKMALPRKPSKASWKESQKENH